MAKKTAAGPTMSHVAAFVFAETAFAVGGGMESAMDGKLFIVEEDARNFWLKGHAKAIQNAIEVKKIDWEDVRSVVTPRARDLGIFAAYLALADHGSEPGLVVVKKEHVEEASHKVRKDERCKPTKPKLGSKPGEKPGGGDFCEF